MENRGLQNFISIGNQIINLAYIVRFVEEDDGAKMLVYLFTMEAKDEPIPVHGEDAVRLKGALSEVRLGRENLMERYSAESRSSQLSKLTFDVLDEEKVKISDPDAIGE